MKTTIVAALCFFAIMVAGCDESTPTSPTSGAAFQNFANLTPDGIRGQVRDTQGRPGDDLDLARRYEVTFIAAPSCSQLPPAMRSRTLTGLITPTGTWWPRDLPVIERVGPDAFLTLVGTVQAPVITSPPAFTAAFDGSISFCSAMLLSSRDHFPPSCDAPVECRSDRHQLRFVRR